MLSLEDIRALGEIIDTTWGRSSTGRKPTMSFTAKLTGENTMTIMYKTVSVFANEIDRRSQMSNLEAEGKQAVAKYLKRCQAEFKKETGRALKAEIIKGEPSMEIIQLQSHVSPKRNVYFRYNAWVELE